VATDLEGKRKQHPLQGIRLAQETAQARNRNLVARDTSKKRVVAQDTSVGRVNDIVILC
jgi:hypothetical protein